VDWSFILTGERVMYHFDVSQPVVGKASIEIDKPIADVFRFVGERFFDNYPKWALEVSEFKPLTGTDVFVGAKAQQTRLEEDQKIESVLEVSEFEPLKRVTLTGVGTPFRCTYQFSGEEGQDITELEFSFEILKFEPFMWPFEKSIRVAIEEGAENTVENIKDLMNDEPK
jgi:Polyketide cyclase / dehydrase and lipid transport